MTDPIKDLMKIKEHVDQARQQRTRLEGQLEQIHKRLQDEFGCASAAEAQRYVDELEGQIAALELELSEGVEAIRSELGW